MKGRGSNGKCIRRYDEVTDVRVYLSLDGLAEPSDDENDAPHFSPRSRWIISASRMTTSQCHEDFQFRHGTGTMCHHRSPTE